MIRSIHGNQLIFNALAMTSFNSAKAYLQDNNICKLIVADQGGLWKVISELIGFLVSNTDEHVILIESLSPVLVNRLKLHDVLLKTYDDAMQLWYAEYKQLESNR